MSLKVIVALLLHLEVEDGEWILMSRRMTDDIGHINWKLFSSLSVQGHAVSVTRSVSRSVDHAVT
jgi:hypothetical protein